MPLSGGQYHWVSILAPARWAKFLSYITGISNPLDSMVLTDHIARMGDCHRLASWSSECRFPSCFNDSSLSHSQLSELQSDSLARNLDILRSYRLHRLYQHLPGAMATEDRRHDPVSAYPGILCHINTACVPCPSWNCKGCFCHLH
jgi:hypothetical protein